MQVGGRRASGDEEGALPAGRRVWGPASTCSFILARMLRLLAFFAPAPAPLPDAQHSSTRPRFR